MTYWMEWYFFLKIWVPVIVIGGLVSLLFLAITLRVISDKIKQIKGKKK